MEVKHYEGNGRLSVATECNGIIHMTGRTCMPGSYPDIPSGDDVKSQTAGVLKIIDNVLAKYGSDKEHILFAQVFLKDVIRDFDDMNEVWESWVTPGCEPARATVQAQDGKGRSACGDRRDRRSQGRLTGGASMHELHYVGRRMQRPTHWRKRRGRHSIPLISSFTGGMCSMPRHSTRPTATRRSFASIHPKLRRCRALRS